MAVHVTPSGDKWKVKTGGKTKAYRIVETQKEAEVICKKDCN